MPSYKITKARKHYTCTAWPEWAHDGQIRPGDETLIITYFARDYSDFNGEPIEPLGRQRLCSHCLHAYRQTHPELRTN